MKLSDEKGLTLIDTMILLLVFGIFMAGFIRQYNIELIQEKGAKTYSNEESVANAIDNYFIINRYSAANNEKSAAGYPCPADMTLPLNDPNLGISDCAGTLNGNIHTGMIPFITLGIPRELTVDSNGNRFIYATKSGASEITVKGYDKDAMGNEPDTTAAYNNTQNDIDYIIVAAGENASGFYSDEGISIGACPDPALPSSPRDSENCDGDDIFVDDEYMRVDNDTAVDNNGFSMKYDDMVKYRVSTPSETWNMDTEGNLESQYSYVSIGDDVPQVALDVDGDIKIENGDINVGEYCEEDLGDGVTCTDVAKITTTGMNCDDGNNFATTIAHNDVDCDNGFLAGVIKNDEFLVNNSCEEGKYVAGINSSGKVICKEPPK